MNNKYVYFIKWESTNKMYIGSKSSEDANPNTFFINYFTSSNVVKEYIKENGNPSVIKILKTFSSGLDARLYEHRILHKVNAKDNINFLNMTNGSSPDFNTIGKVVVKDSDDNTLVVDKNDSRYINGELKHIATGTKYDIKHCEHCDKMVKSNVYASSHGDKCKVVAPDLPIHNRKQTDKQKANIMKALIITNIFDFKKLKPYEDKLSVSFKNDLNIFFKNELQGKCTETTKTHLERLFIYETDESVIIDKVKAFMLLTNGQKVSTSLEVMQLRWGDAEGERRYKDKCEKDYVNHNKMKQQRLDKFNGKYVTPKMVEWYTDKGYSVKEAEEKIQQISDKQSETIKETLRKKAKSVQI